MPLSYSGPGPLYGRNARWKDEFTDLLLPLRTTLPGKRGGRREIDSKEKTEEKTDMAPLEPMYSISSLLRAIFSKRVLFPTFWTFPDKRMLFLSMLLSLTIADRHLTCNKVFIARNKEIGWALPCYHSCWEDNDSAKWPRRRRADSHPIKCV